MKALGSILILTVVGALILTFVWVIGFPIFFSLTMTSEAATGLTGAEGLIHAPYIIVIGAIVGAIVGVTRYSKRQ